MERIESTVLLVRSIGLQLFQGFLEPLTRGRSAETVFVAKKPAMDCFGKGNAEIVQPVTTLEIAGKRVYLLISGEQRSAQFIAAEGPPVGEVENRIAAERILPLDDARDFFVLDEDIMVPGIAVK